MPCRKVSIQTLYVKSVIEVHKVSAREQNSELKGLMLYNAARKTAIQEFKNLPNEQKKEYQKITKKQNPIPPRPKKQLKSVSLSVRKFYTNFPSVAITNKRSFIYNDIKNGNHQFFNPHGYFFHIEKHFHAKVWLGTNTDKLYWGVTCCVCGDLEKIECRGNAGCVCGLLDIVDPDGNRAMFRESLRPFVKWFMDRGFVYLVSHNADGKSQYEYNGMTFSTQTENDTSVKSKIIKYITSNRSL